MMADRLEGRFGPPVFVSQAEYDAMVASGRVDSGVLYAICEEVPVASSADDGTVRFPAECGCVVAVTLEEPPLSRDEVERGCDRNDAEVTRVELVTPCPLHHRVEQTGLQFAVGGPISQAVEAAMVDVDCDPLGERRANAFTEAVLSARDAIQEEVEEGAMQAALRADAERRLAAHIAQEEADLRRRFGAALVSGLAEQARLHPGFRCEMTADRDMLAVSGILTVSELVESVVLALGSQ